MSLEKLTRNLTLIGSLLLMLTIMGCGIKTTKSNQFRSNLSIGKVVRVQKLVLLNGTGKINLGDTITLGDVVTTKTAARIEIVLNDGTSIKLGQDSELLMEKYLYQPDQNKGELSFDLKKGDFAVKTGRISKQKRKKFSIRTVMAIVNVRGTTFWGGSLDGVTFDVALLEGQSVSISNEGGTVLIDQIGFGTTLKNFQTAPSKPKKWPLVKINKAMKTVAFE